MRRIDDQGSSGRSVTCAVYREALSAEMDGEHPPVETAVHLAGCPACAGWARLVPNLQRPLRMRASDELPDLTERILTAITGTVPRPSLVLSVTRAALMALAIIQGSYGAAHLLSHPGAGPGSAVELGAWGLAIGIAFGTAALRPTVAYAVLPMVAALATVLCYTSLRGLLIGEVAPQRVLEYLLIAAGSVLLALLTWLLRRREPRTGTAVAVSDRRVRGLLAK